MAINYSLYLVTDRELLNGRSLAEAVEESIKGGVSLVQLREKDANSLEFYKVALEVKSVTDKYNVPLIINDRVDIALAVDAAGVHVGQSDLPAKEVRKIIGNNKIVGVSTSTIELALKAQEDGADYVGVGAMFTTTTKSNTNSVTIDGLRNIKKAINIPVVAIGGIGEKNVDKLIGTGIDGIAVISDILKKENVRESAQKLNGIKF